MNDDTVMWAYLRQCVTDVHKDLVFILAHSNDPKAVVSKVNSMLFYVERAKQQAHTEELAHNVEREQKFAEIRNRAYSPYVPRTAEGKLALSRLQIDYVQNPQTIKETVALIADGEQPLPAFLSEPNKNLAEDTISPENPLKQYSKDLLSGLG